MVFLIGNTRKSHLHASFLVSWKVRPSLNLRITISNSRVVGRAACALLCVFVGGYVNKGASVYVSLR